MISVQGSLKFRAFTVLSRILPGFKRRVQPSLPDDNNSE